MYSTLYLVPVPGTVPVGVALSDTPCYTCSTVQNTMENKAKLLIYRDLASGRLIKTPWGSVESLTAVLTGTSFVYHIDAILFYRLPVSEVNQIRGRVWCEDHHWCDGRPGDRWLFDTDADTPFSADCLSGWWFDWWRFWSGICNSSTVPVASDDVLANSKPRKGVLLLVILSYIGVVRTNEKGSYKIKVVTVTVLKLAVNKCMVKLVWSWKFVSKLNMIVVVFSYQGIRDEPGSK